MLVRRLVTGVRSSCDASATSWRCEVTEASSCCARALEPLEHLVEASRQLADLVVLMDRDPLAEIVGLADQLGGGGDLGQRRQHAASGHASEAGGEADHREEHQRQDPACSVESTLSTASSGRASWMPRMRSCR